MNPPLISQLHEALDWSAEVAASTESALFDLPTPCPEFTVGQLCGHLVGGLRWVGGLPTGGPVDPTTAPGFDHVVGACGEAFRVAAGQVRSAWDEAALTRDYDLSYRVASGSELVTYLLVELLGHGWDLLAATGRPVSIPADLAAATLLYAQAMDEAVLRSPGMMGPPVPVSPGADPGARLVAFLGRQPC